MWQFLRNFWREEEGQDLIEYSLLVVFIAIACCAMIASPQGAVKGIWTVSNNQLTQANALVGGS
jgi:Flp pilus assembly pilin Flp